MGCPGCDNRTLNYQPGSGSRRADLRPVRARLLWQRQWRAQISPREAHLSEAPHLADGIVQEEFPSFMLCM